MYQIEVQKKLHSAWGEMVLDISMTIPQGAFISLYGKSGAGKTSLLKMITGLLDPDQGKISSAEEVWFDKNKKINLSPQKRKTGVVFQDYALFPTMTVRENLSFALKDSSDKKKIDEILSLTGLSNLASIYPGKLSGGQQQRVALARALVRKPQLLLLDEPFSSLDTEMKSILQEELRKIHKQTGTTIILISHDIFEIMKMSDTVYEIDRGHIIRQGTPSEVFENKISNDLRLTGKIKEINFTNGIYIATVTCGGVENKIALSPHEASVVKPGDEIQLIARSVTAVVKKH